MRTQRVCLGGTWGLRGAMVATRDGAGTGVSGAAGGLWGYWGDGGAQQSWDGWMGSCRVRA